MKKNGKIALTNGKRIATVLLMIVMTLSATVGCGRKNDEKQLESDKNNNFELTYSIDEKGYDSIQYITEKRKLIKTNEKWGVFDENGKEIIPQIYDCASSYIGETNKCIGLGFKQADGTNKITEVYDSECNLLIDFVKENSAARYKSFDGGESIESGSRTVSFVGYQLSSLTLDAIKIVKKLENGTTNVVYLSQSGKCIYAKQFLTNTIVSTTDFVNGKAYICGVTSDNEKIKIVLTPAGNVTKQMENDLFIYSKNGKYELVKSNDGFGFRNEATKKIVYPSNSIHSISPKPMHNGNNAEIWTINNYALIGEDVKGERYYYVFDIESGERKTDTMYYIRLEENGTNHMLVSDDKSRWGYMNDAFEVTHWYKDASNFNSGFALVKDETGCYIINENFEQVSDVFEAEVVRSMKFDRTFLIERDGKEHVLKINK